MAAMTSPRINLDEPRYDQNTFIGRAKHFFITTNPLNLLATPHQLDEAKNVVEKYSISVISGQPMDDNERLCAMEPFTIDRTGAAKGDDTGLSEDELWAAKHLYDSAYHPDTKEKMFILGRMSAQVPMNMSITGCMMTFYKTPKEVVFWQWFNQTFNAIVNYTNRSGDHPIPVSQLALSYVLATGGAVGTALTINSLVKKFPPVVGRMVPFAAVAAANCINIPCMRSREVLHGVPIFDENGNKLGESKVAARSAITQVVFSRIMMATPGMMIPPFIMEYLNKKHFMQRMPYLNAPIQVLLVGFFLIFATPLCCALFPQKSSLGVSHLEKDIQEKIKSLPNPPEKVYFNKGL